MSSRVMPFAAAAIAIAAAGCDGPAPDDSEVAGRAPTFIVRDSAGIEIVENHAPEHAAGEFWTIDPEPEFVLGGADETGEPAHDSAQLVWDVVGLARVEDGRVAVLSSRGTQLLLFEPSGKLSRIIGRKGEGPGEFTGPEWLQYLPPDTLVVWDYFMTSIDYFDTAGRLLRQRRVDHAKLLEVGIYGENLSFPITGEAFIADMMGREVDPEPIWSDCSPYEAWTHRAGPGGQPISGGEWSTWWPVEYVLIDSTYSDHSLGCPSRMAAGGDPAWVYIPARDRNEIYQLTLDGALARIIRRTTELVPYAVRDGGPLGEEGRVTLDSTFDVVVDTEGYLWVMERSGSSTGSGVQWSVYSAAGRWLGVMPVPWSGGLARCQGSGGIHGQTSGCWVDRDFFVILRRDELGVEMVEGYRIRRGG